MFQSLPRLGGKAGAKGSSKAQGRGRGKPGAPALAAGRGRASEPSSQPNLKDQRRWSKEICQGKRFQRAAEHSNRVQIFEYFRVCGPFLMLLPRNITAFPLALIFIFSFITRCITALSKRERKKADPPVNRSNSNS